MKLLYFPITKVCTANHLYFYQILMNAKYRRPVINMRDVRILMAVIFVNALMDTLAMENTVLVSHAQHAGSSNACHFMLLLSF